MAVSNAQKRITETLLLWEGVSTAPHRFGGVEYRLGTRELGHIHGDHLVDIPFPKKVRDEIVDEGLAEPHHILLETGWVSFYLRMDDDVQRAVALLRRSYEIALRQKRSR
jgi:luciferase-like monooxygenase